jgi:hypothetical protein
MTELQTGKIDHHEGKTPDGLRLLDFWSCVAESLRSLESAYHWVKSLIRCAGLSKQDLSLVPLAFDCFGTDRKSTRNTGDYAR